ncbi:MAG TPA: hypothetical protein VMU28_16440 [Terriglobales bacterium]|nr:hypothetical protein [Terriglobales bacterium]
MLASYVYTAGASNIAGYSVNSDGSLSPVPNSPYTSATDNYIVTNGSNVYTVNSGGTELEVYSIKASDGSLALANTTNAIAGNTSFSGDIVGGLSLDHTGASLYIGEIDSSGDDGQNVWSVGNSPSATQVQWDGGSEVFGPPLVWSPNNLYAYSGNCYHAAWTLFSYTRASNGTLTSPNFLTGGPPVLTQGDMPCPLAFAVSAKGFLAVAYSATPQGGQVMIGTYALNNDGTLTPISGSQVTTASNSGANGGNAPVAINFDPTGTYLAAAGNGGIQTFTLGSTGLLSPVSSPIDAATNFQNVAWDKSNHVFATTTNQLYVWNFAKGTLTPATGSPYGGGTGLAVLPLQ